MKKKILADEVEAVSEMLLAECDNLGLILIGRAIKRAHEIVGAKGYAALTFLITNELLVRVNNEFPVYQVGGRQSTELMI